jgi:hypothetical protein
MGVDWLSHSTSSCTAAEMAKDLCAHGSLHSSDTVDQYGTDGANLRLPIDDQRSIIIMIRSLIELPNWRSNPYWVPTIDNTVDIDPWILLIGVVVLLKFAELGSYMM